MGLTSKTGISIMLIVAAICAGGCGGEGGDAADREPTGASAGVEFVKAANAACANVNEETQANLKRYFRELDPQEKRTREAAIGVISAALAPGLANQLEALEELDPPASEAADFEAVLAKISAMVDLAQSDPKAFADQFRPYGEAEDLARSHGYTACGHP